jgi:hypothetical protein
MGFIGQAITVEFDTPPQRQKYPHCPDRFIWESETLLIVETLAEWIDYGRRDRMASNMQPAHAAIAAKRGSWGVGRFFFQVRVADGRCFELYYDRAPKNADNRLGGWILRQELPSDNG